MVSLKLYTPLRMSCLDRKKNPNQSIRISNFTNDDQGMINESRIPEITNELGYLMDS